MTNRREFLVGSLGFVSASCLQLQPSYPKSLKGVPILRMDAPNKNKNYYPTRVVEKALRNLQETIGYLNCTKMDYAHLSEAAFRADNFVMTNGSWGPTLWCDVHSIDGTPQGRLFSDLVQENVLKFDYRTCGIATGTVDDLGVYNVETFQITGVIAVPAGQGA